ncbi:BamA/TamA family outer membrane protein [Nodosilinea sp. LEGE 06152]|uniref:BamA/TamA family outer membrane protein n=1 Tax=Nodosilinea sp. LEGE 06152 TaxID=2777966 RepID=UPI00187E90FD|nr:BamA/TamA family outer membrane protein [Nodosilinea sp. LEGE 06152]MBE9156770.1 BamA/TamA family outer membrane protein [Nodosilinea sp. LEGE 06152]
MRVSPNYLLAVLATSGLVGLITAPAQANPAVPELRQESSSESGQAVDSAFSQSASSLAAPEAALEPGPAGATDTLDFGLTQPDAGSSPVAEVLQGAIDDYRAIDGEAAADSVAVPLPTDSPAAVQPQSTELAQTPSTPREISPEEAQRILDGAVQRRSQPQPAPNQQGQTETPVDPDPNNEAPDESAEEEPEAPVEAAEEAEEPRVLVAEVQVQPTQGELDPSLENLIYSVIDTQAGRTTTRTQLQQDINSIFATGFFADVDARPEDTDLGVRVTFVVQPNPVLTDVRVQGNDVLPQTVVDEIFDEQKGEIINLIDFQEGILELNQWYQDQGYVLAQVVAAPQVSPQGVVTLEVAEGVIESIEVRYINDLGQSVDDEGNPVRGRTRPFIITREFETEPGEVFNQARIEQDFQRVFGLGIFEDVVPGLEPAEDDPRQVKVIVNVSERNTGSVAAGLGFNFTGDLFGTVSFRQDNFGGNNQKFSAEAQLSTRELLFDLSFTDPWIAGDPFRTSYTATAFARSANNLNFEDGPNPIDLPNGDQVRIRRLGTGITFSRPLNNGWTVAVGTLFQNVSARDQGGRVNAVDAAGNPLTASSGGVDDLWTFPLSATLDRRNDAFNPTSGSILRLNTEQSIPLGRGSIFMNRLRGSYSYYIPLSLLNFAEGPQALALNVQAGTIVGDVPPYEAFALGGTNSIRGYDEGEVGSGRSYAQFTAEYRFPLFSFLGGALFLDVGSDLGSGNAVPGAPGPSRGKPGSGIGYGAGVRLSTPLGPLRIDYGFNNQGQGRIHFGFGERF